MSEDGNENWKHVAISTSSADDLTRAVIRHEHEILMDESSELPFGGHDEGPSPVDLLLTSLTACQASVLQQCFEKARIEDYDIEAEATIDPPGTEGVPEEMPSNTANRVEHVNVELSVTVPEEYEARANRCVGVYDQGCIVGQSLREGIDYTNDVTVGIADGSANDD